MKRRVYICAPLKGDIEGNVKRAIWYARYVFQCGAVPVVPHFYVHRPVQRKHAAEVAHGPRGE